MTEKEQKVNFKTFENEHIKVFWNPKACTHAGICVRGNGNVCSRMPW